MKTQFPTALLAIASLIAMAGCATAPVQPLPPADPSTRAEVLVYREHALNAGVVSLAVGVDGRAFAVLENRQLVIAQLPAGRHTIFVQARSAQPTTREVQLAAGERTCLRTTADPENFLRAMVPGLMLATGYRFLLDVVPCPPQGLPPGYQQIPAGSR